MKREMIKMVTSLIRLSGLSILLAASAQLSAHAGTGSTGGGKGALCRVGGGKTLETLDMYEARVLYRLKSIDVKNNKDAAIQKAAELLVRHDEVLSNAQQLIETALNETIAKISFVDAKGKLPKTNDGDPVFIEPNCEEKQIAVYYDESVLVVDTSLWKLMDWKNKISLVLHEVYYQILRIEENESNSAAVRKFVGHLLSEKGLRSRFDTDFSDDPSYLDCTFNKDALFGLMKIYKAKRQLPLGLGTKVGYEVVFRDLPIKKSKLFRTSIFLSGFDDFFNSLKVSNSSTTGMTTSVLIDIDTYPSSEMMKIEFERQVSQIEQPFIGKFSLRTTQDKEEQFKFYCSKKQLSR